MPNPIETKKFFPVLIIDRPEKTRDFYVALLGSQAVFDYAGAIGA